MAIYAIGDVQGCYEPLQRLLDQCQFNPTVDTLWLVGDLVNRGPDSLLVLRWVKALGDAAITVLGNHDLHLLAVAAGHKKPHKKDTLDDILHAPDRDELLTWLRHRPLLHYDSGLNTLLIHAGLPPQWDIALAQRCARELEAVLRGADPESFYANMYGDMPDCWHPQLTGWERLRFISNCFTRLRYCDAKGRLRLAEKLAPKHTRRDCIPWFQLARPSVDTRIVFGHWSTLGFYTQANVIALDTGCLWGGQLTAIRLDAPSEPCRPYSVACRPFQDINGFRKSP